jgi:hypothetical protein
MMTCQMQLRMGFGGPVGFDHAAFVVAADTLGLERDVLFALLPHAESGMLKGMKVHRPKTENDND